MRPFFKFTVSDEYRATLLSIFEELVFIPRGPISNCIEFLLRVFLIYTSIFFRRSSLTSHPIPTRFMNPPQYERNVHQRIRIQRRYQSVAM
jgi:hypothetical protein